MSKRRTIFCANGGFALQPSAVRGFLVWGVLIGLFAESVFPGLGFAAPLPGLICAFWLSGVLKPA
tara:strand:+ start:8783 stop:8977 length:195 start_codon:yes stop_codon:yes gene_type:complete